MATELLRRTITDNPYIPLLGGTFPSRAQSVFLSAPCAEILYGGAAGGGKSAGLLAGGLQYVDQTGYDALILRRSYADLEKPGGLISLSHSWLSGTDARYNGQEHRWTFPSGATLSFGHVQNELSVQQDYQGSAFAYIGFDELTQFSEFMYRYLFSRLRKAAGLLFPVRMRSTSNPGGVGHSWVKKRLIDGADGIRRMFIPAKLADNPGLDETEYSTSLDELDPITRRQLKHGDWDALPEGEMFRREWFASCYIDRPPVAGLQWLRYWDLAATKPKPGKDPDYAAGCLLGMGEEAIAHVADMRHFRESPRDTENRFINTARADGTAVSIRIEQEPGAASKLYIESLARRLPAYDIRGVPSSVDKVTRAKPASAACERGDVKIVSGLWNEGFIDELCAFPAVQHDDQVDAFAGAYNALAREPEPWEESDVSEMFSYQHDH